MPLYEQPIFLMDESSDYIEIYRNYSYMYMYIDILFIG